MEVEDEIRSPIYDLGFFTNQYSATPAPFQT